MSDAADIMDPERAPAVPALPDKEESLPLPPNEAPPEVSEERWQEAGAFPFLLGADVPLKRFTVRDLLHLQPGSVLESTTASVDAVPVVVNRQTIGWAVFEVVADRLAVRVTELA